MTESLMNQIRRPDAVGHVDRVIKKNRFKRKVRIALKRPMPRVSMTLQRLFESCREVFRGLGTVPSARDVKKLCHILDGMKPEDVGLSMNLQFFKPKDVAEGSSRVTFTTIYQCENFSLCIFFLPATAVIPLHNHPEMTVFTKLLLGTMNIKAYDWVDPLNSDNLASPSRPRLARMKANREFTPRCNTSVLYPTSGGNIHEFTAVTPCAVLDVMGPPYSKDDGRDCSYYRDTPCGGDGYGWLEEIEMPNESEMDGIEYLGPKIIDFTT
ncbi:plant cysteine oxidase 2-like [Olea europaea var. sylvestris]|uniref:plant cysteine oxidase 2-like n=1 Tax=Olea europaea var. sylvestris TaxID=158386 RepID=UPI000C1D595D|nr:plant cysteine oxidase 2-like [Olea europaea var. sylvestris]